MTVCHRRHILKVIKFSGKYLTEMNIQTQPQLEIRQFYTVVAYILVDSCLCQNLNLGLNMQLSFSWHLNPHTDGKEMVGNLPKALESQS